MEEQPLGGIFRCFLRRIFMKSLKRLYYMQNIACVLGFASGIISAVGVCMADSYSIVPMLACLFAGAVSGITAYVLWVSVKRNIKRYQREQKRYLESNREAA